ncbi:hypothetical protein HK104_004531 [Borealophlyctis nickersoniae]|nr:hypothetical protein HK104_004531 [Borealophlyctis nickersoniae]
MSFTSFFNDPFFSDPFADMDRFVRRAFGGSDSPFLLTGAGDTQQQQGGGQLQQTSPQNRQALETFLRGPKLDLIEGDKEYTIKADLPGLNKDEVQITVDDNTLTISGERKDEKEEKEGDKFYRRERTYGKFTRSVRLPPNAKVENAQASMENGVLTLKVAKEEEPDERKRIQIHQLAGAAPLLGMIIAGVVLRNSGWVPAVPANVAGPIRSVAVTFILCLTGLGVSSRQIRKEKCGIPTLAVAPFLADMISNAAAVHLIFDQPWLWTFMFAFGLAATAPAVIVPLSMWLEDRGLSRRNRAAVLMLGYVRLGLIKRS